MKIILRMNANWHRLALVVLLLCGVLPDSSSAQSNNGCGTGGEALAEIFVLSDPASALLFLGDQRREFIQANRAHFRAGADSVRCASAVASLFYQRLEASGLNYGPENPQLRQAYGAALDQAGVPREAPGSVGRGSGMLSPSQLQDTVRWLRLLQLASALPSAVAGDFEALDTMTWADHFNLTQLQGAIQLWATDPNIYNTMVPAAISDFRQRHEQERRLLREVAREISN